MVKAAFLTMHAFVGDAMTADLLVLVCFEILINCRQEILVVHKGARLVSAARRVEKTAQFGLHRRLGRFPNSGFGSTADSLDFAIKKIFNPAGPATLRAMC